VAMGLWGNGAGPGAYGPEFRPSDFPAPSGPPQSCLSKAFSCLGCVMGVVLLAVASLIGMALYGLHHAAQERETSERATQDRVHGGRASVEAAAERLRLRLRADDRDGSLTDEEIARAAEPDIVRSTARSGGTTVCVVGFLNPLGGVRTYLYTASPDGSVSSRPYDGGPTMGSATPRAASDTGTATESGSPPHEE
jgi:hypothetical protein